MPPPPSRFAGDIDPAVERAILRCLAKDPGQRPRSVAQVLVELPGGDPLEALVAAGQTPSPELVGASGEKGTLAPGAALRRLAAAVGGLAVAVALARSGQLVNLLPAGKSPPVLLDRAQEIAAAHRGPQPAADSAWWLFAPRSHRSWLRATRPSPERYRGIGQAEPTPVVFYYRDSPRPLAPPPFARHVTYQDPPLFFAGEVVVGLDLHGHLVHLAAIAPETQARERSPEPEWRSLFEAAGLRMEDFEAASPAGSGGVPGEARRAWRGEVRGQALRVDGAAHAGRVVFFDVGHTWDTRPRTRRSEEPASLKVSLVLFVAAAMAVTVLVAAAARRNLRVGRGDRRGARRLAVVAFGAFLAPYVLDHHHVLDARALYSWFQVAFGAGAFAALFAALAYLAVEPALRRRWPQTLVSWARLVSGRWNDPLVGRHALSGVLVGLALAILAMAPYALAAFRDWPGVMPRYAGEPVYWPVRGDAFWTVRGFAPFLGGVAARLGQAVVYALGGAALLALALALFRSRRTALVTLTVLLFPAAFSAGVGDNLALELPFRLAMAVAFVAGLARGGLLVSAVSLFTYSLLALPLTLDATRWYAPYSFAALALVLGLAAYGVRVAVGRQPLVGDRTLGE